MERHHWNIEPAIDDFLSQSASAPARTREDPQVVAIYDKYRDAADDSIIGIEGTLLYIDDLGLDPNDAITLVLAFFLDAPLVGVFYRDRFVQAWLRAGCSTLEAMRNHLRLTLWPQFSLSAAYFKKVYNFTFEFLMENPGQKLLPYDLAIDYWRLLLVGRREFSGCLQRLAQWFQFIEEEHQRGFLRDTWQMFLLFVEDVMAKDPRALAAYDEMAAWPSVVDEYMEWLREHDLVPATD